MNLESIVSGVRSMVQEAIKVRPLPSAKKPARGMLIGPLPSDLQGKPSRSMRSIDFSRPGEGGKRGPDASPLARPAEVSPWSNWPAVQSIGHLIDGARHRVFGSASRVASEPEPMVMHRENPHATPHLAADRGACGLCISYARLGQNPVGVEMVAPCPGCGRGRGHELDCQRVLGDFGVTDDMWENLPQQIGEVDFDRFIERRGG